MSTELHLVSICTRGMCVYISSNIFFFISLGFEIILIQNTLFHQLLYWKDIKWLFKWIVHCLWLGRRSKEGQWSTSAESSWIKALFTAPHELHKHQRSPLKKKTPRSFCLFSGSGWSPLLQPTASSSCGLPLRQTNRQTCTYTALCPLQPLCRLVRADLCYCSHTQQVTAHPPVTAPQTHTLQPLDLAPIGAPRTPYTHMHTE